MLAIINSLRRSIRPCLVLFVCFCVPNFALAKFNGATVTVQLRALDEAGNAIQKQVQASEENGYLVFEGDILLSPVTGTTSHKSPSPDAIIHSRNSLRWPDGIVYYQFDADYSESNKNKVQQVMRRLETYANIRFEPRSNQNNYVSFADDAGCSSYVGMIGGAQRLSLAKNCFSDRVIEHELLHALGFWHEHSRSDRDEHVEILFDNVEEGKEHNFNQHISTGIDIGSYDFLSVMHYARTIFSGNGEPTIVRKNDFNARLGGNRMSNDDKSALQLMYGEQNQASGEFKYTQSVDFVPPAYNELQQGFVRVRNHQGRVVNGFISGYDDAGNQGNDVIHFALAPYASMQLNSSDLEFGNRSKNLVGAFGTGEGNWRITVHTDALVDVSGYIRTIDGFMTQVDAVTENKHGRLHKIPMFNPASNNNQVSKLRLINLSANTNRFTIEGIDDRGDLSNTQASIVLAPRQSVTLSAQDIENGRRSLGLIGSIGDGKGKWFLEVYSERASRVMNLLEAPGGYLSNLSRSAEQTPISSLLTCDDIDGARIYGSKGNREYLGFLGSAEADDSVLNAGGSYGDSGNSISIHNQSSIYGSTSSEYSHQNSKATTPPIVVKNGKAIFYLSTNNSIAGTISYSTILNSCTLDDAAPANMFDLSF